MNERIRELIKEADRRCSETRRVYDEILIGLIVRDCIAIVNNHKMRMDSGPTHIIEDIKQHFGVEE
jgi:hypothetical protein